MELIPRGAPRTVRDLMARRVVSCTRDESLTTIAARMRREDVSSIVLLNAGRLTGIITERDLIRAIGDGRDPRATTAGQYMTDRPMTVRPGDPVGDAAALMLALGVRHLPVVEDDQPVGLLSARDVVRMESRSVTAQRRALR